MDEIELGRVLTEMRESPGWQAVEAWIQERVAVLDGSLLRVPVRHLCLSFIKAARTESDALKSVLRYVEEKIAEGREGQE